KLNTGNYQVSFPSSVTGCAYVGGIGGANAGTPAAGSVGATNRAGIPSAIFVTTFNAAGTLTDLGFHVAAFC
ncbi:MAG TPA: hypothetical protein VKA39_09875, partial [Beijerinckiaceae bacterium]|nr:hypothetical protein [Beijerinckiaceae bacterium]